MSKAQQRLTTARLRFAVAQGKVEMAAAGIRAARISNALLPVNDVFVVKAICDECVVGGTPE